MSKTVRVRTTPNGNDSYLKVKVEQDFDFIEILSLKISQAEAYSRFCSDYGVVVGRVIINNGFGVANAKVSIFVPLTDEDEEDSEIKGLYPFSVIDDKDNEGIRYNLLQHDANPQETCFTPVGTFPAKREVIDNDTVLEVYDKYYKFTTTTNDAGDFMLFGVPTGNHTLNCDVDLSDIGNASQRPYDYITAGESPKKFESPTKFKGDKDLDKNIQIKTYKKGVNVQPFWGDKEQCDIGITRLDIDIKKRIVPSAIFMGALFSDSEKNSVNKNCRPRKDFGRICETDTGEGTVEMIRKTLDGKIERFDVEGGRVVNEFGSWAYQIPMNLDVRVTDEFGNLVPSEDPNKGLATKARVRFRVSKDVSGDEGRLRTTASYLVPHNPPNASKIDYNFDENTSDEHFRDFHWNKIYSVSNYIPRIQAVCLGGRCADNRNMTGIKDVDDCVGRKNPFPFNRVDTDFNPLFTIICIILSIITLIIWLINSTVIAFVNFIIVLLNAVLKVVCKIMFSIGEVLAKAANLISKIPGVSFSINKCDFCIGDGCCNCDDILSYVPCISLTCAEQDFAPGCNCSGVDGSNAPVGSGGNTPPASVGNGQLGCWKARVKASGGKNIQHWSGINFGSSNCGHSGHNTIGAGVTDCFAIQLAEALNMFEFDFYNDWINGVLYTYLLKFKKKKRGSTKFCDSECDQSHSDNGCDKSWFVDTCVDGTSGILSIKETVKTYIDEGYVKMITKRLPDGREEDRLYYAPHALNVPQKLFATELVHLGSIFDCDWQGIPKIQQFLVPTTYKRTPYIDEYLIDVNGSNTTIKTACGMTSTGSNGSSGVFFDIDCRGLTVGRNQWGSRCDNFKRQCEFGMNIDEAQFDSNNAVISAADCYLNDDDLTQPYADRVRDIFYQLNANDGPSKLNSWPAGANGLPAGLATGFGTSKPSTPTSPSPIGTHYQQFRGTAGNGQPYWTPDSKNGSYVQSKNSFYFYFGTMPGQSAVELMNRKFFTTCELPETNDFAINLVSITDSTGNCDGAINITVIGGEPNYIYNWSGPTPFTNPSTSVGDLTNLCAGVYTLTVTDANGGTSTVSYTVNEPPAFNCSITTTDSVQTGGNGNLIIQGFGGISPYIFTIDSGAPTTMVGNQATVPKPAGTYIVVVTDDNGNGTSCPNPVTTGVIISEPPALNIQGLLTGTDTTCGYNDGTLALALNSSIGGTPPYSILVTGPNSYSNTVTNVSGLISGTYTYTITDGAPNPYTQTDSVSYTVGASVPAAMTYINSWYCWEYNNVQSQNIYPSFNVSANGGFTITAQDLGNGSIPIITQTFPAGTNPAVMSALHKDIYYDFSLEDDDGCEDSTAADFTPGMGHVPAVGMKIDYSNSTEKYCWTTTNPDINPKFDVWADGPFTISWNGSSPNSQSFSAVPAGTNVSITSFVPADATEFILTETTVRPAGVVCTAMEMVNFTTQIPSSQLIVNAPTQGAAIGGTTNSTTLSANVSGGWGSNTYTWYRDGSVQTTVVNPTVTDPADTGSIWKLRITDSEGCTKYSNLPNLTIS